jgi:hypothetical protein
VILDARIIGDHVDLLQPEMYLPLSNGKSSCVSSEIFHSSSVFDRLLFSATTIMATIHVWRTRGQRSGKHDPAMEVHQTAV